MGHLDGPSEGPFGVLARPVLAQLVGEVGQQDPPRAGLAGVLARLRGGDVAARALALGARQRGLDDEQVGVAREVDDVLVRGVVGAVGDAPAAVGGGDLDRVARR